MNDRINFAMDLWVEMDLKLGVVSASSKIDPAFGKEDALLPLATTLTTHV